jgi:hypothetical protein
MVRRAFVVVVAALTVAAAAAFGTVGAGRGDVAGPTASRDGSYGWPVKPFARQHPVRGNLGDPRIGPDRHGVMSHTLHLGVDVVAPNGTPVYATLSGWISIHPLHSTTVVISDGSGRSFEYWHVNPCMTSGHATAYETVIGHVKAPAERVNFSERIGSTYLNPLRPGAMSPYGDDERPGIGDIRFERSGHAVGPVLHGAVDVVVGAYDPPVLPVPAPWDDIRITPALVRWRVVSAGASTAPPWHVAFDTRYALPATPFFDVYAAGTRQNRDHGPGWYRFYLARHWATWTLPDGRYVVEVSVVDIRSNEAIERVPFVIANSA